MTSETVIALVGKHPGKTSTELAKLVAHRWPVAGKDDAARSHKRRSLMNGILRRLAFEHRVNRFSQPGINPKVKAWRHYPIYNVLVDGASPNAEPFTIGVIYPGGRPPDGVPPVLFSEFLEWLKPAIAEGAQRPLVNSLNFADFVIESIPRFKDEEIKRILAAAAQHRLSSC